MPTDPGSKKDFRTVGVIKVPVEDAWQAMRDELAAVVELLPNVESVKETSREVVTPRRVRITNAWKAAVRIPPVCADFLKPEMLGWIDIAEWDSEDLSCEWSIEPNHFRGHLTCAGRTCFTPAMGGRGTRLTFEGELGWQAPPSMNSLLAAGLAPLFASLIPGNYQKLTKALGQHLEGRRSSAAPREGPDP